MQIEKESNRVALLRKGSYSTRISNFEEMADYLESRNFQIIDPSMYSEIELKKIISNSAINISEGGSCGINLGIYAESSNINIILAQEELFKDTRLDMHYSGLPYVLGFGDRIRFVLGKTKVQSPIQSSIIAEYDIGELSYYIDRIW